MSHFVGLVFGSNVETLLEPYDENMEVEQYVRYTKDEAIDEVKTRHADNYEYAIKLADKYKNPTTEWEKDWITMRMGVIAISENNLHLQICRLGKEYPGVYVEGCMSPKIFGLNIKPTKASITSGCTCSVQTYGIGEYDTCKMGCKYCYATIDHNLAKRIPENPNSELISGEITEPIKYVNNRVQISQELSLFD